MTVDGVSGYPSLGQFSLGNDSVSIVEMVGWAPEPVWMDTENLAHTGFLSRDRPALSVVAKPNTPRAVAKLIAVYFQYHMETIETNLGQDSQLKYVTSFGI